MRKALLLGLAAAACSSNQGGPLPVIGSFTVDDPNPEAGAPVHLSYSVTGATGGVGIFPVPGAVYDSPVTVVPPGSVVFTLRAFNQAGMASRDLAVNVRGALPLAINATDASPGQVGPGGAVTLSWSTTSSDHATLTDGTSGAVSDVPQSGSQVVHPAATTVYTLTAYNKPGRTPATLTARITARVATSPSVGAFTATPASIVQGDPSTLTWTGNATSYSVDDGTSSVALGPRRSLVVRPSATTTYTLRAEGPGGKLSNPPTVTVTVEPHPGSTLSYTGPSGGALQLVADPCPAPCASMTLRIRATAAVQLRGAALDLPLDATKVGFDPGSFTSALPGAVGRAAMGSGPLRDALVLGIALAGNGSAPAPDVTVDAGGDLAQFSLTLLPAGCRGTVFDGFALAASPGLPYKASVQRASGRTVNAIAIGKLEAQ
jgi:hypothetical protein